MSLAAPRRAPEGLWQRARHTIGSVGARTPSSLLLGRVREQAARAVVERHRAEIDALSAALEAGTPDARHRLERVADHALGEMRTAVASEARRVGFGTSWAAAFDAWWRDTEAREYLDDPGLDQHVRLRILTRLDEMNECGHRGRARARPAVGAP